VISEGYLTVAQAGDAYPALGERYFRRLIAQHRIRYFKVGARVLLHPDDIQALIDAGRVEPVAARLLARDGRRRA